MIKSTNENIRLASLAVFRELYNNHKDVYEVISCFLSDLIISKSKYKFNLSEIANLLNETYNFNLPEAVVKISLKRLNFLIKEQRFYTANLARVVNLHLNDKTAEISKINNSIISGLFLYIENQKKTTLTPAMQEEITQSFCSFILNRSDNQSYVKYISAFILNEQQNTLFTNQIKTITEGVVLYTGLMFNEDIGNVGSWNSELTIFLETELLFDFLGYNGKLYHTLFNEFFTFVKEINQKATKPLIKLKYFTQTKNDVERFFKKAEYIVAGNIVANPGKTAMCAIIDGCSSQSDVVEKKVNFYKKLSLNNIIEDKDYDYFQQPNHKFNIYNQQTIEKMALETGWSANEITDSFNLLNLVNIRRNESCCNNFENIRYILLSGNSITNQIAWNDVIKQEKRSIPLATNLDFLTNKFWFKLNKGFGSETFPKTFDIITKAQILLSAQLTKTVTGKFEELQNDFKNGKLTKEQVTSVLIELRKEVKKPEEIDNKNLAFVLDTISESSIEKEIREHELFKHEARQQEIENEKLKIEIAKEKNQKIEIAKNYETVVKREETVKSKIQKSCHKKYILAINCCLWIILGLIFSIIILQWYLLKIYLSSFVLLFLMFISGCIFIELRFKKQLLTWLPPKFKEWLPSWLNFPEIRINLEHKLIQKCIIKKKKNIGLND